jgi:DEAD/DEAH box helicase domain-containing protein
MNFDSLISQLRNNPLFRENISFWQDQEPRPSSILPFPEWLNPRLTESLLEMGINGLYSHQTESLNRVQMGQNVVVTTGTASGKSICYQLPILNQLLQDGQSTALLFFPTKALTYDQLKSFSNIILGTNLILDPNLAAVYDGDTPSTQRGKIKQHTRILLTNPDMLNIGILPHHTNWAHFFEHLRYIVIDEIHLYRGVFGSHVGNLIRRLKRVCEFYNVSPQFIMTSATIANPIELAQNLIEDNVNQVDLDGSPKGAKSFIIYNPPLVNQELGIREGVLSTSSKIAAFILYHNVQALVFCGTRRFVELLTRELKGVNPSLASTIRGYRSGYLKKDRREIEEGLKKGSIKLAVATNALELGVDIGGVDAVLLAGYPGSICSLRQRIGRSGRSQNPSLSILVTSMNPLDQFFARNPQYLMARPLEQALINPNNPLILLPHIKSAAFELPFAEGDHFGSLRWKELVEYLDYLCSEGVLQHKRAKYYWLSESYPSNDYSLRSTMADKVLIQYEHNGETETIGEVDYESALWMVHPGAVYLQDGLSYIVKTLDLEKHIATLSDHRSDFITEPILSQDIEPLAEVKQSKSEYYLMHYGEIMVTSQVTAYRRIQNVSKEVLSIDPLELPAQKLQTTGFWMELNEKCVNKMRAESVWLSDANDYGKDWKTISESVRERDNYRCQSCGRGDDNSLLHVHHKIPFKCFTSVEKANDMDNLITLCPNCHRLAELSIRMRSALSGLKYLMSNLAPLLVLSEPSDLGSFADPNAKFANMNPVILIYDSIPAGIGLASSLNDRIQELLQKCYQLVHQCECQDGCPSCVGPAAEMGLGGKQETTYLLDLLINGDE